LVGRDPSPTELRAYADELEVDQAKMVDYYEHVAFYIQTMTSRELELKTKLRDGYDITEAQMFILWNKAWQNGHSEGFRRVVEIFDDLYELASEFAALEKN
jgi:hypothetical protein